MNKKKLITMAASLAMVAIIGVGATLAYMTSTTDEKTNTFTVGKVEAGLVEETDGGKNWDDTTDGKDMYPGQEVVKMPIMSILEGSSDSYAFLEVTGADALVESGLFTISTQGMLGFSADWVKVQGDGKLDGVYRYKDVITKELAADGEKLPAIFDKVTYSTEAENGTVGATVGSITVVGCAVQADGMDVDQALAQVSFTK